MSELDPVVVIGLGNHVRAILCARYMAETVRLEMKETLPPHKIGIVEVEQHWSMRALHPTTQEDTG